ncbi:hypothetical protein, conserved in T. vivax [Trypanosoma vivax Y486]|uniref:Uncharacterized protein n=1 Tax=Trypanosoma vivax (strain Y486) TaxID=1055687 RepID=F9WRL6_TRYVY|nr:hypothetical protein, conserved in T. vivax [Trypanosoma vivax Y486]|eukprot:CCD20200.1 hypothetical protein, conserved in T. vivax [Trypanosoma vivax Y486]
MKPLARVFQLLVFTFSCTGAFAAAQAAAAAAQTNTAESAAESKWVCQWWGKKLHLRHYAVALRSNLTVTYTHLEQDYSNFTKTFANAGALDQVEGVSRARSGADVAFWKFFAMRKEASKYLASLVRNVDIWQDHHFRNKNASQECNGTRVVYMRYHNVSFDKLYDELNKSAEDLFNFSSHNASSANASRKVRDGFLNKTRGWAELPKLAMEAREGFAAGVRALDEARKQRHVFNQKMAFGCAIESRLNVMKDTFVALKLMLEGVIARDDVLLKRAALLQLNAAKLQETMPEVTDTQPTRAAAVDAIIEVSSALTKVLIAMHNSSQVNFHTLLQHGTDFQYDVSQCKGNSHLERIVLLHLVADERKSHYDDFASWRDATTLLWEGVTDMKDHADVKCEELSGVNCATILSNVNALLESSRRSRALAEAKLGDAISAMLKVDQQIKRGRAVLEAKLEELRRKRETELAQGAVEAEPHDSGRSAVDGTSVAAESASSEKAFNVSFDGLDDSDSADDGGADELDGLDFDTSSVGGMRSAVSSGTIALVVLLPIVIIALAVIAWFVLRRKRHPVKNDPST